VRCFSLDSRSLFFASLATLLACAGSPRKPPPAPNAVAAAPVALPTTASARAAESRKGSPPPPTVRRAATSEFHGVRVVDEYAWLQNPRDPEVKAWGEAQNGYTRSILDAMPDHMAIRARVRDLLLSRASSYSHVRPRGPLIFAIRDQPPKQQPFLVVRKSLDEDAAERVLVDPNVLDETGKTTIDFYVPSRDGKLVAVSLSQAGSESGTVHVYEVATGKPKGDEVPRVNGGTAGGSLAWNGDATGFFYTRYPREAERPAVDMDFYQQVYFHRLGAPTADDTYEIGKEFPRIAETELETSEDGRYTVAAVANGDGGEFAFHLRDARGRWTEIARLADKVVAVTFGRDDSLYLLSRAAPRGQVLRLSPPTAPLDKAEVIVPESDVVIKEIAVTPSKLFVADLIGGPSQIRAFALRKAKAEPSMVPTLPISNVTDIQRLSADSVLFLNESYVDPPAWYRYDARTGKTTKTALAEATTIEMRDADVTRETCVSRDGTKVPLNVVKQKGATYDGASVALLTGYGGYGLSRSPRFRPMVRLWLDHGGVYADANLRGGSEFGEAWHLAGNLTKKQNVFDDFYACAAHLVEEKATAPERLGIMGGSNGGLLMGATLVQRPEAYRAVVSLVGIYDMLHVEDTPNGAFNVTEFGTVKDPDQFRALYGYSPYHRVKDGTPYPAVLFLSGANDPRVDPYHSRKMTARLQAATRSPRPILLRASSDTGHGGGTPLDTEIDEMADVYTFLFHELGIPFRVR
jgi:prolyl oligopeptidase